MKSIVLDKKHKLIILPCLFIFFLIWQWNGLLNFALPTGFDAGIENLEAIAAADDSIDFGKDINDIYSCLGWLYLGINPTLSLNYGDVIFKMVVINVLSALLRTVIIAAFWKNATTKFSKILALLATILVIIEFYPQYRYAQINLCILTSCILIYTIHSMLKDSPTSLPKKQRAKLYFLIISVAILMAIVPLVKFSYISMSLVLSVILIAILCFRRRFIEIGVLIGAFLISTVTIWSLSGEKITHILSYFKSMLNFVGGYSESFSLAFSNAAGDYFPQFILFLAVCITYGAVLLYLLKHNSFYCVGWFIIAPFIFLWFKEMFVRSDYAHVPLLEYALFYILCYLLFVIKEMETNRIKTAKMIGTSKLEENFADNLSVGRYFYPILLTILLTPKLINKGWYPTTTVCSDFEGVKNQETFLKKIEISKNSARNISVYTTLYDDIRDYPDATLGMLSNEQTFFIAYDLLDRFKINPIVSLYENTTSYKELATKEHYSGEEAPDILLFHPEPLDGVNNMNRLGTIFEAMLQNYHLEKLDTNGYLVLQHDEEDYTTTPYSLGEPQIIKIGESIEVPKVDNAYVFMKVDWNLTPFGTIASFLLKPTQTRIEMITDNGTVYEHRFLRTLAENGIYVSNWVESPAAWGENSTALADVFKGDILNNSINSIRFIGDNVCYDKEIEVSFYAVPFSEKQTAYQTVTFDFGADVVTGAYQMFYGQGYHFTEENSKWISVGFGQKSFIASIPSEDWDSIRLDLPAQAGITCDLSSVTINNNEDIQINLVAANDIVCEQIDSMFRITTTGNDPYIIFSAVNMAEEQNVIIPTSRTEEGACSVDSIFNVSGDDFSVNGWALNVSGNDVPSAVYVSLNNKYYKMERMAREDIAALYSNDNLTNSGFGGYISTENLPAGTYPVELIVISADGKSYYSHYVCSVTV